jgi:hypothetical protein
MAPPIKTHCLRGHPFTEKNIMLVKLKTGYIVRRCRRCRAEKDFARYHSDVAYQAKVRARALERYRENA